MTPEDFTLHSINLREARHDTKVGLWKSGNEVIEEQLENLKLSKIRMKAEIVKKIHQAVSCSISNYYWSFCY